MDRLRGLARGVEGMSRTGAKIDERLLGALAGARSRLGLQPGRNLASALVSIEGRGEQVITRMNWSRRTSLRLFGTESLGHAEEVLGREIARLKQLHGAVNVNVSQMITERAPCFTRGACRSTISTMMRGADIFQLTGSRGSEASALIRDLYR
jgi:hypothetical protein